jgi:hypothetical protein
VALSFKVALFRGSHGRRPTTTRPLGLFFVASLPAGSSGGCPHHSVFAEHRTGSEIILEVVDVTTR